MLLEDPLLVGWYTTDDPSSLIIADGDRVVSWLEQYGGEPFWIPNGRAPTLAAEGHLRFDAEQRTELERSGEVGESESATYVVRVRQEPFAGYTEIVGARTTEPTFSAWHFNVFQSPDGAACSDDRTDDYTRVICSNPLTDGQWHVAAFVMESAGAKVWTDGVLTETSEPWALPAVLQWNLGTTYEYNGHWTGDLTDLAIWRRALTDQEIGVVFDNIVP
jgi:hypothetical protein